MTLKDKLTVEPTRALVVKDCCTFLDDEVKRKSGLSGIAIKGAFALVKAVKPGFVAEVVDSLLDEWVEKLEPVHADWHQAGGAASFAGYVGGRSADVADRLLQVTDSKLEHAKSASVKKAYTKLRPSAKKHVEEAVPRLATVLERHLVTPAVA